MAERTRNTMKGTETAHSPFFRDRGGGSCDDNVFGRRALGHSVVEPPPF